MSLNWEAGVFGTTPRHLSKDKEGEIYFKENRDNLWKRTVGYELPIFEKELLLGADGGI